MDDQARQSIEYHIDKAAELALDSENYECREDAPAAI